MLTKILAVCDLLKSGNLPLVLNEFDQCLKLQLRTFFDVGDFFRKEVGRAVLPLFSIMKYINGI